MMTGSLTWKRFQRPMNQRLWTTAPYGRHVLRGIQPHTGSAVGQTGGGHGGNDLSGMTRGVLGRLNGNNQAAVQAIPAGSMGAHAAS